jgi:glucokinase
VDFFKERLGLPAFLENDANACALAEWKYGAGRGTKNMVFLTFGTGMGAGLILNGALYSGTNDLAGEIGHVRAPLLDAGMYGPVGNGKAGSFEGFCSGGGIAELGRAVAKEALQRGEKPSFCEQDGDLCRMSARYIAQKAEEGDPLALSVYERSGRYLGGLISVLIDILNPQAIVIGSIFARSRHLLEKGMNETLAREAIPRSRAVCKILPVALGEDLGDVAALAIVL